MKYLVNISIDDISPHPMSNEKCLDICFDIIKLFPNIKFTLYIPMGYWRIFDDKGFRTKTEGPLYLNNYLDLCKKLKRLPKENFELCYHGVYHNDEICNNNEFGSLSYNDACQRFEKMYRLGNSLSMASIHKNFVSTFLFEFLPYSATSPPISLESKKKYAISARINPFYI